MASNQQTAGIFDIRSVIGVLLGLYGLILLVTRLFAGNEGGEATEGLNANLWAGLALLVIGVGFVVWARVRPVVVEEEQEERGEQQPPTHS